MSDALVEQLRLLPDYLGGHMFLTMVALASGVIACVPLGVLVARVRWLQWPVLTLASVLQTIPGLALLALMVPLLGMIGVVPALLALTLYSFLPILRNTVTGLLGVDSSVIEAARGIGMTDSQRLRLVEIPLAMPVIIAGIRTAAVWVVGTATLATPVGATSLGNYVFSGLQTQNVTAILVGCGAAASLAIVLDQLIRLVELASERRSRGLLIGALVGLVLLIGGSVSPVLIKAIDATDAGEIVVIGSKPFSEQYILAELMSDRLEAAGFEADVRSGMGSMILFEALTAGEVDCYVDYSGTIWTNVMKRTDILPREELLHEMTIWLEQEYGVICLGGLGFENTYALAMRQDDAVRLGIESIDDLSLHADDLSIGSDYEFFSRPEWKALQSVYGLAFNREITMDPTLMYRAIEQGDVDVISAYSTDGRVAAYNLTVLKDPKQALPPYDAIILLSPAAGRRAELIRPLHELVGVISDNVMRRANKLVDMDSQSVDSAAAYLHTQSN